MKLISMDSIQNLQEEEYNFPYHHLVDLNPFSQTRHLWWGYKYAAYLETILELLAQYEWNSIIDIGCGDGKMAFEIQRAFPDKRIVGTDYSEKSLAFAHAFSPSIEFSPKTEETFDTFVMIEVLEHIPPHEMHVFLDSVNANLRPGGFGIITTPSTNIPINHKHYQHFTKESIEKILGEHFVIERFEFLNAKNPSIIQRLLANKFFILNYQPWVSWLYKKYKHEYLHATASTATQVLCVVRKK